MRESKAEALWQLLQKRAILVLAILFLVAAGIVLWHNFGVSRALVETTASQHAALYSEAIAEFRTLYTREVVETVRPQGIEVTHDNLNRDGAIPLPATLSMRLGEKLGESRHGAKTFLYSPYFFPFKPKRRGLKDAFAKEAWEALNRDPTQPFQRFETYGGRSVLRYATADLMRPECIDCHNSHKDSPKTDWEVDDVRGVLEVILPMDQVEAETRAGLRGSLVLMALLTGIFLAGLWLVIGRLKRTSGKLERRVAELDERGRELQMASEQLVVARDEALAASRAKSQFLAAVSHELRTPMNVIIGYTEMLQEETQSVGHREQYGADLEKIHEASTSLLATISQVLEYARAETEALGLQVDRFEAAALLDDLMTDVRPMAERSGNTFRIERRDDVGTMRTDMAKLRQCLLNVLSNAFKFTEKGSVSLAAVRETVEGRDWVLFDVTDTGIGMSPDQMEDLFDPFTQVDASSTREHGGTGLGLALARRWCLLLGGDITVKSELGKGSTFTVRVPAEVIREKAVREPQVSAAHGEVERA